MHEPGEGGGGRDRAQVRAGFRRRAGALDERGMLIQESKVGDDRETYGEETSTTQTRVFEKTMAYAKRFANCTTQQQAHNMREACVHAGLHDFEVAMFVNIVPQNYDEAKTLVPSLMAAGEDGKMRFDEHHIENLISELNNIRQFD